MSAFGERHLLARTLTHSGPWTQQHVWTAGSMLSSSCPAAALDSIAGLRCRANSWRFSQRLNASARAGGQQQRWTTGGFIRCSIACSAGERGGLVVAQRGFLRLQRSVARSWTKQRLSCYILLGYVDLDISSPATHVHIWQLQQRRARLIWRTLRPSWTNCLDIALTALSSGSANASRTPALVRLSISCAQQPRNRLATFQRGFILVAMPLATPGSNAVCMYLSCLIRRGFGRRQTTPAVWQVLGYSAGTANAPYAIYRLGLYQRLYIAYLGPRG